jgi:hypothetical protein
MFRLFRSPDVRMAENSYILLGASNLTISAPLLLENLHRNGGGAADVCVAMGFGRSYGGWSRFLFRDLPGIVDCGLWNDLPAGRDDAPLRALITDVGNDLVYGHTPERIAGWVEDCVRRLQAAGGDVVLTLPPVESLASLSRWRYTVMRTMFFPFCRTPLDKMCELAADLHARLNEHATSLGIPALHSPGGWYGFDPIHIRRGLRSEAWRSILSAWQGTQAWEWSTRSSSTIHRETRNAAPALCRRRGRERTAEQPAIRAEGFRVSFY